MNWRSWRIFRWIWPRNDVRRYGAVLDGKTDDTKAVRRVFTGSSTFYSSTTVKVRFPDQGGT